MNRSSLISRVRQALSATSSELLASRQGNDHWTGRLSSSALSTATAITALALVHRARDAASKTEDMDSSVERIVQGARWLAQHQNADGGWGDTTLSVSNISTTTLVWAALGMIPDDRKPNTQRQAETKAESWLAQQAGIASWKDPQAADTLAQAIINRYGKDRTFSVPILTMCALAGRLGNGPAAWRKVIPLPFELAACPRGWFAALRLPVVSYALPALIAIGQARFCFAPPRNPLVRWMRQGARSRTLRVLESIQPVNGGFLEATPLTSFVTMSLAGIGQAGHAVTRRGVQFLNASQRSDGSWPIDTNLATWVTTLSVNALLERETATLSEPTLNPRDRAALSQWLLGQQYHVTHPYTGAAPGAWAWTDLPGGVPDADDTAGALLALAGLNPSDPDTIAGVRAGLRWLLDLQNRDGGVPTFCRGWGHLPFDRSSADITAHAIRAWLCWTPVAEPSLQREIRQATERALAYLRKAQRPDGSWVPLWFGNQFAAGEENPAYGTARVLSALGEAKRHSELSVQSMEFLGGKGARWLLQSQNANGSWSGVAGRPEAASVEETALALEALAGWDSPERDLEDALEKGALWLLEQVESGQWKQPSPIGFYFAKLWYYERLYPLIFTVGALRQLNRRWEKAE